MFYCGVFILLVPLVVNLVHAMRRFESASFMAATFIFNFLHHEHACKTQSGVADSILINTMIFALLTDIPMVYLQTENNLLIGRRLALGELAAPVTGVISAGFAVNLFLFA